MSINVTVNGNPICVRRSRMVLTDLEQIKKNERDRRRRLRLEQVRQQSKEISGKLLERAKNFAKKELSKLQNDGMSVLRKMHNRKITEIQRKYEEDMDDIGMAHSAAAQQPDVEAIIQIDRDANRAVAVERGREAMQRLKESAQNEDPVTIQQGRLRQVREVENLRSAMVANLPRKNHPENEENEQFQSSQDDNIIEEKVLRSSSKKKRNKKTQIIKKSPTKVVSKSNVKVVMQQKTKSPRRVIVDVHRGNSKSPKRPISRVRKDKNSVAESSTQVNTVCRNTSVATEVDCSSNHCNRETDDQEPRKTVPTIKLTPTKIDKVARYNPEDYKPKTSDTNGSSSSSTVSDDSSYFSDGCSELILPKTTPKHHTSLAGSKVQLYDHSTRQRNSYNQPVGLVERINIRNEPNAEEVAREIAATETITSNILENRRQTAQRRGNDAILRDRVRRDYNAMMKNLDHLTREERKLKALQNPCCTNDHMSQARRKECQNDRQRKMDRAFETILRDNNPINVSRPEDLAERIITLPPQSEKERGTNFPEATWQDPPFFDNNPVSIPVDPVRQDNTEEMSREEHILEMLKKVERQKRLLLREFGADLPNTIFSASMTPLMDGYQRTMPDQSLIPPASIPEPQKIVPSPEIKIINMSSSDEKGKKSNKKKPKAKTKSLPPVSKTIETAVQTSRMDEIGAAKDKSTQVEIVTEESNDTATSEPLQYIEPLVQIVTPEVADSSSSSSGSRYTGIVIELDKRQVKVTPKKRKTDSERSSKRSSSRPRAKPRSLPTSTAGSPVKRTATSAPSSRSGSPKKIDVGSSTRSRSPDKIIDIRINKASGQGSSSRKTKFAVDSSIESSPVFSTPEVHESSVNKPYRIFKQPTYKRVRDTRDVSDTSTSYASLPAPTPGSMQSARHQITPILEMLDSSANESARASRRNVSPVSTPETPSPRIMNIPSNIPHPARIGRILRYGSFTNSGRAEDSTLPSSTQNEQSTSTDPSYSRNGEARIVVNVPNATSSRRSEKSSGYCSCTNPTCELFHTNIANIRDYATRNHPEVLKKYDDLQNVCTERIASLTELIKRVRNEQQSMEFSVTNPADETSLMQLPPAQPHRSDLQSVQRLVESIEAIHGQLARTLQESQKIITSSVVPKLSPPTNGEIPTSSTSYETKSKGSASTSTEEPPTTATASKAKPKIVANEPVQIDIEKLKRGRSPYTAMLMSTDAAPWLPSATPHRHEEIVAKLYQEILEQSKTVDGSRDREISTSEGDRSLSRQRTPSPPQHLPSARKQNSPQKRSDSEVTRDERSSPEQKKDEEFVPLLAGIPKIPRPFLNLQPGTRPRPPPASGIYRSEMGSPRHELSTIVEFDTPDTANRSQGSTRSPTGKSRRLLQLQSPTKSTTSAGSSTDKNVKTQTLPIKPSVEKAPLISQNMARTIPRRITMRDAASPDEKFVCQSPLALSERGTTKSLLSQGPSTSLEYGGSRNDDGAKSSDRLQSCDAAERDVKERDKDRITMGKRYEACDELQQQTIALPSSTMNNDDGANNENKVEKITSTSSNSFSGLSGISEIVSTPTSDMVKWASSSEEIETALKKMGLGWAIVTLKKTREASALSSSSNSDVTPMNTARRTKSPGKKQQNDGNIGLPDFSDVSSISIKEASKSTERAVLMKARTSTPNIQNSNSSCEKTSSTTTSSSGISLQDHSDSLTAPNLSLTNKR